MLSFRLCAYFQMDFYVLYFISYISLYRLLYLLGFCIISKLFCFHIHLFHFTLYFRNFYILLLIHFLFSVHLFCFIYLCTLTYTDLVPYFIFVFSIHFYFVYLSFLYKIVFLNKFNEKKNRWSCVYIVIQNLIPVFIPFLILFYKYFALINLYFYVWLYSLV